MNTNGDMEATRNMHHHTNNYVSGQNQKVQKVHFITKNHIHGTGKILQIP